MTHIGRTRNEGDNAPLAKKCSLTFPGIFRDIPGYTKDLGRAHFARGGGAFRSDTVRNLKETKRKRDLICQNGLGGHLYSLNMK